MRQYAMPDSTNNIIARCTRTTLGTPAKCVFVSRRCFLSEGLSRQHLSVTSVVVRCLPGFISNEDSRHGVREEGQRDDDYAEDAELEEGAGLRGSLRDSVRETGEASKHRPSARNRRIEGAGY